jgi:hypothetical protein
MEGYLYGTDIPNLLKMRDATDSDGCRSEARDRIRNLGSALASMTSLSAILPLNQFLADGDYSGSTWFTVRSALQAPQLRASMRIENEVQPG